MWALGNIAGDGPECRDIVLNCGIMDPLLEILDSDQRQKKNATWTLSNLCRGKNPLPDPGLVSMQHLFNIIDRHDEVFAIICLFFDHILL